MKITKETQAQARRLMRLCIGPDGLMEEETVRHIAAEIETRRPRNFLPLLSAFAELVRQQKRQHTAIVTSALPLTEEEQNAIRAKLDARHTGLEYHWNTDPSLIAGITVQVADNVTDASVKSRISRLLTH